jgi:hypothetical protein
VFLAASDGTVELGMQDLANVYQWNDMSVGEPGRSIRRLNMLMVGWRHRKMCRGEMCHQLTAMVCRMLACDESSVVGLVGVTRALCTW